MYSADSDDENLVNLNNLTRSQLRAQAEVCVLSAELIDEVRSREIKAIETIRVSRVSKCSLPSNKEIQKTARELKMEASYQGDYSQGLVEHENFPQITQTIASNIKKMSQNVTSMAKMITQLQTPQDSQELRNQLRQIQNYTQKMAKDTSALIIELMKTPTEIPANKLTRERLRDEYMTTLNAFQATQKVAAQRTREDVRKAKAQSIVIGDPFAIGDRGQGSESGRSQAHQQQLTAQPESELQQLEEREQDIRQLENDIMDVNSIFKELGTMIHEQGTVVSSIESSVEYASQNVESATRELNTAATYKNKLRKKKIYLAIILIIVVAIILIIAIPRG